MEPGVNICVGNLDEMITNKKKDLDKCEEELRSLEYSYMVRREALMGYKIKLQEDLINTLKESKGIFNV
ncbi:hypothetical protein [Heyndrickxia ginsengihumi]|uniref:hypothetical protein n=1 Tax=Heyndrickxia ginsengihumi TaxID=363870 RepID=UPI000470395A|nr:hypothetical protein [Heyndrickxia ginsengihumi]